MASTSINPDRVVPALTRRTVLGSGLGILSCPALAQMPQRSCRGDIWLTIDTGSMAAADEIATLLQRYSIRASFFLANERTITSDRSLEGRWWDYWRARAAEGHAFASHTWRHWYLRADRQDGRIDYIAWGGGQREALDRAAFLAELERPAERFAAETGSRMVRLWRAPGGRTTPRALAWAESAGWRHIGWTPAGFLGDELDSDRFPNSQLLAQALRRIGPGDILVMHTGIWDRKDPFIKVFEPLLQGLLHRGLCFRALNEAVP
ncbi:MAG: polysaccharide deacetylase family protein [Alphaproteobacteria bacterium]|nr:polysaccharide deacetylase family protein [Alphaproteobacteria bacterium]TAD91474.1 MAG: polysaccharide deacetylase family protein [Alphaproteobacteria bacterium]